MCQAPKQADAVLITPKDNPTNTDDYLFCIYQHNANDGPSPFIKNNAHCDENGSKCDFESQDICTMVGGTCYPKKISLSGSWHTNCQDIVFQDAQSFFGSAATNAEGAGNKFFNYAQCSDATKLALGTADVAQCGFQRCQFGSRMIENGHLLKAAIGVTDDQCAHLCHYFVFVGLVKPGLLREYECTFSGGAATGRCEVWGSCSHGASFMRVNNDAAIDIGNDSGGTKFPNAYTTGAFPYDQCTCPPIFPQFIQATSYPSIVGACYCWAMSANVAAAASRRFPTGDAECPGISLLASGTPSNAILIVGRTGANFCKLCVLYGLAWDPQNITVCQTRGLGTAAATGAVAGQKFACGDNCYHLFNPDQEKWGPDACPENVNPLVPFANGPFSDGDGIPGPSLNGDTANDALFGAGLVAATDQTTGGIPPIWPGPPNAQGIPN